jgi:hypothetical protein
MSMPYMNELHIVIQSKIKLEEIIMDIWIIGWNFSEESLSGYSSAIAHFSATAFNMLLVSLLHSLKFCSQKFLNIDADR